MKYIGTTWGFLGFSDLRCIFGDDLGRYKVEVRGFQV